VSDSDPDHLLERLRAAGVPGKRIAEAIGRQQPQAVRLLKGQRALKASEIEPLRRLLDSYAAENALRPHKAVHRLSSQSPVLAADDDTLSYVPVAVLPTFAGMGGGGTGDDDTQTALVPRSLIEGELRGQPDQFLLVNVRGDSMEPDFHHGDQLLVDRRDRSPIQPGPFALRYESDYVVKNVERVREGLRIFSSNSKYREDTITSGDIDVEIIGRPVWFGRRV
jgi:phage repressor protein C with HTH and peptisase S24 domain